MAMTLKEMNLRVFRREPLPHVFFQPRFEPWFAWNKQFNSLPEELRGKSLREVYDSIGASMRTVHYYTGQPNPIVSSFTDEVKVTEKREGDLLKERYETPRGPLFQTSKYTVDRTWRVLEFPAKTADDLPALRWMLERRVISFSAGNFETGSKYIGDRGEPQFWVPKSPYFAMAQQWMKYEDFIFTLADHPREVEDVMRVIDESYDRLYEELVSSGLLNIINFGENIDMAYLSPRYFEDYCIPWYEKRAGQLRRSTSSRRPGQGPIRDARSAERPDSANSGRPELAEGHDAGIFTHIHIDGYFKPLLPYLSGLPFDGLEALTPLPQGDVTVEEMGESLGDKILLDGIPAVLFLKHHPREQLHSCVERLVELFHPRLVMGVSDELPEAGDEESFERLKWVADYCRSQGS